MCVCKYWSSPHRHPLPYMVCTDPESGRVKKVSACLIWHRVDTELVVQEQGLKNFEVGDTQYTQGLTSDYYRGDPGDCP